MSFKTYPAKTTSFPEITADVRHFLQKEKIKKKTIMEYELLTEELLIKMVDAADDSSSIHINFQKGLFGKRIIFSCAGAPVSLKNNRMDFGAKILQDYAERISFSRKHDVNQISVSTGSYSNTMTQQVAVAGILAMITCLILYFVLDNEQITWLVNQVTDPVLNLFIKLLENLAVPIAFVSLLAYIINFYDSVEFDNRMTRISIIFIFTSVIATLISFFVCRFLSTGYSLQFLVQEIGNAVQSEQTTYLLGNSLKEVLEGLLPSNLLEIFTNPNPLPMLVIAILFGIGINAYSSESNMKVRDGVNAIMDLLSNLITIIFATLPFFFYFAVVDVVLYQFSIHLFWSCMVSYGIVFLLIFFVFLLQFGVYALQLLIAGISPAAFFRKYKDVLRENLNIASNMDALPYNIRSFRRKLKDPEKDSLVRATLNLGANINMDGNCLIITMMIMLICGYCNIQMDVLSTIEMLVIILLLGVGSPNQPGSFTIGMIVLMGFLGISKDLYPLIIITEGLFCKFYSSINAFGDIVTVAALVDDDLKKKKKQKRTV